MLNFQNKDNSEQCTTTLRIIYPSVYQYCNEIQQNYSRKYIFNSQLLLSKIRLLKFCVKIHMNTEHHYYMYFIYPPVFPLCLLLFAWVFLLLNIRALLLKCIAILVYYLSNALLKSYCFKTYAYLFSWLSPLRRQKYFPLKIHISLRITATASRLVPHLPPGGSSVVVVNLSFISSVVILSLA